MIWENPLEQDKIQAKPGLGDTSLPERVRIATVQFQMRKIKPQKRLIDLCVAALPGARKPLPVRDAAQCDNLPYGEGEIGRLLLQDRRNPPRCGTCGHLPDVLPIDHDPPPERTRPPVKKPQQRGLACAIGANDT